MRNSESQKFKVINKVMTITYTDCINKFRPGTLQTNKKVILETFQS